MELLDGGWRWWPHVVLRGAGFPADGVDALADPELMAAADAVGDAPDALRRTDFAAAYAGSAARIGAKLREIAADPAFRTALTWQNHHLVQTGVAAFADGAGEPDANRRNSKDRQREELVASYWQRYCVKNDSIGFFGPVGWARLDPDEPASRYAPGPGLVAHREVFFEAWAVGALARTLQGRPGFGAWLAPRLLPFVRLRGRTLVPAVGRPVELGEFEARVLGRCDGLTPARELVPDRVPEVLDALAEMVRRRWIAWQLDLPASPRPELTLRAFLVGIGDPELRTPALADLDRLEAGRAAVAAATEPAALHSALSILDGEFTDVTGAAPSHHAGRAYGGRTLVYHDSRRDADLTLGRDLLERARPVGLLAQSARWLCAEVAAALREPLREHLRAAGPGGTTDLANFWFRGMQPIVGALRSALPGIRGELDKRWDDVLRPEPDATALSYAYADLWPRVRDAFAATAPGWAGARAVSPDIMVCGPDLGDPLLVLGELHTACNTQRSNCFVTQHPDRAELLAAVDREYPDPQVYPVLPLSSPPRLSIRTHPGLIRDRDFLVEFGYHTAPAGRPRLVQGRDVAVCEREGVVVAVLPTGECFPVLDVFGEVLMDAVLDQVRLFGDRERVPRVTVDRMVLSRRTWRVPPGELGFAKVRDEAARYLAARTWARALDLPRRVFLKVAGEKPVYLDLASPVLVNVAARAVRRSAQPVTVVEMLPDLGDLWLTDREGRRYTAELRLVAFDQT